MDHSPYFGKTLTELYCYFGVVLVQHRLFILQLILKIKTDQCKQLHQSLMCHVAMNILLEIYLFSFKAVAYLGLPEIRNINYSGCDSFVTSWNFYSTWGIEES